MKAPHSFITALLYNKESALPLSGKKVTLFGRAVKNTVRAGGGAGSTANETNSITLHDALAAEGFSINEEAYELLPYVASSGGSGRAGGGGNSTAYSVTNAGKGEQNKAFYDSLITDHAGEYTDAAIVMIGRVGSEGNDIPMAVQNDDNSGEISGLALFKNEKDMLQSIKDSNKFGKIIVLLNSASPMETYEIEPLCDAILFVGTPGRYGLTGAAEILSGKVNPSGHLVDTYAKNSLSSPAVVNSGSNTPYFANADAINETIGKGENADMLSFQAENIYIGYRYYETRYADSVMAQGNASNSKGASFGETSWKYENEVSYPFGYGLSYSSFKQTLDSVDVGDDTITVKVTVENTGSKAGKSVVQVYAQTPYGEYEKTNKVEKSAIQLVGFGKTEELAAGAKTAKPVEITIDKYLLASYDANGAKGYILSGGDYYIAIGNNAHDALNNVLALRGYTTANGMTGFAGDNAAGDANLAYTFPQQLDTNKYRFATSAEGGRGGRVTNQFEDCDLNYWIPNGGTYLTRSDWNTFPTAATAPTATADMMKALGGVWYEKPADAPTYEEVKARFNKNSGLSIASMKDVPISNREAWEKFIYQIDISELAAATAESFTCPEVGSANTVVLSPSFGVGDGCNGGSGGNVNQGETAYTATQYCSKNILTGTFNEELYAGRGRAMGEEALWVKKMINYNVGVDLHRTPFGGRTVEYMSECPTISYLAAIPEVEAMQKLGTFAGPKHFVGNDQETRREGVAVFFTEQAFREGNLRAGEGAVRVANAGGIMQSFERLGCTFASAKTAMNTAVLRNEWGWQGSIDTDACPGTSFKGESADTTGAGYKSHSLEMLESGTTQFCLDGKATHAAQALIWAEKNNDGHMVELVVDAAIRWEYLIARTRVINGLAPGDKIVSVTPWWQNALLAVNISLGVLTAAAFVLLVVDKVRK